MFGAGVYSERSGAHCSGWTGKRNGPWQEKQPARSTRNIGVQDGLSMFKLRDLEICWNTYKYLYFKLVFIFCVFCVCLFLLFAVNAALSLRAAASEAACLDRGIEVEVHVVLLQQNVMLNGECLNVVCFQKLFKTCQKVGELSQLSLEFSKVRFQVPFLSSFLSCINAGEASSFSTRCV